MESRISARLASSSRPSSHAVWLEKTAKMDREPKHNDAEVSSPSRRQYSGVGGGSKRKFNTRQSHRYQHQRPLDDDYADTRPEKTKSNDTVESYDMLDDDFVDELRQGWDDLGDSSALSKDEESARRASSRALLARETFMVSTYSLAREFFMRLVGSGGAATATARYGSTSYSRRG
ncbi:hypothetical protein MAPG_11256 [Magnaporthiopsis poae ATCC 64411]|uniref:Uncharacterized protein n=1 Tax=Magnaporthiopsis poae (strain ATCC 64411 / 73-15) TaxID=644358 RepID=A0A0C4EES6_MAGP6|nr:hypothetical protein MAPG_11256 [Magnaporthiopsis poae ATCC 64411]